MQVQKLCLSSEQFGPVPAGRYFEKLAQSLRDANAEAAAQHAHMEMRERKLEARYRRASASRGATFAPNASAIAM